MGALLGPSHPVVGDYGRFLRKYSRMLTRLEFEIDHVHGWRLGPSIMTFHVQLAWRNWMVLQLDSGETESIAPPDFGAGLSMLEMQNKLMLLPSVTNVPLLLSLSLGSRTPAPAHVAARAPVGDRAPPAARAPAAAPSGGGAPRSSCRTPLGQEHGTSCHFHREHPVFQECPGPPRERGHSFGGYPTQGRLERGHRASMCVLACQRFVLRRLCPSKRPWDSQRRRSGGIPRMVPSGLRVKCWKAA
jgi:hypothetical protein